MLKSILGVAFILSSASVQAAPSDVEGVWNATFTNPDQTTEMSEIRLAAVEPALPSLLFTSEMRNGEIGYSFGGFSSGAVDIQTHLFEHCFLTGSEDHFEGRCGNTKISIDRTSREHGFVAREVVVNLSAQPPEMNGKTYYLDPRTAVTHQILVTSDRGDLALAWTLDRVTHRINLNNLLTDSQGSRQRSAIIAHRTAFDGQHPQSFEMMATRATKLSDQPFAMVLMDSVEGVTATISEPQP